ncbi:MAG TPA: MmgE/PrpD family protein [Syntrophales bacterium]|nr:MmgE/PrpD family protein [Syntrophales bacterium]
MAEQDTIPYNFHGMIENLISFVLKTSFRDIPPHVITLAKRSIIDWCGVALGGASHSATSILVKTMEELGGKQQATILGAHLKTSVYNAALINGAMSHVLDYDDTHLGALMHPSAPLMSAILAYGEWKKCRGEAFLLAFLLGFEVETRISVAMGASHYEAGWHSTSTMGRFGAASGVGKMIGLTKEKMAQALGLAGTQASGIRRAFGTMTKSFHPGKAAADGLLSALLAQNAYTSPVDILEGEGGLGNCLSQDFDAGRGLEGLGQHYMIEGVSIKPYASCLYTHPVIDGVIQARNHHHIIPDDVETLVCEVSKFCHDAACNADPVTGLEGKFSTSFCAALALADGKAGEELFTDKKVTDPLIRAFMKRVEVKRDTMLSDAEAVLKFRFRDGVEIIVRISGPLGDPDHPLTDEQLEEKFKSLLSPHFDATRIDRILDRLWHIEDMDDISALPSMFVIEKK